MKLKGSANDPLWYKDAVIYETHVKAFFDSNNDGIGDFQGLTQKLDYLQALGVTCLWLLPFFPSPLKDDGYDISDYNNVHPGYGTMDDFRVFLNAAHERGLQVLIELVVNHTSDQHPWFQAARRAPAASPERDFYVWSDSAQKYSQARIIFTDTEKSNWAWDSEANAYYWHRFFSHQPDLNFDNPAVLAEVVRAMHFWLDMGVDGMRLDAIPYLVEREGTNCENLLETHAAIRQIRRAMDDRYSHRMFLAEANQWPSDVSAYFGREDECHMAFHFPLMPRIFMALRLEDRLPITEIMAQTPPIPPTCQWGLFLRNHDELTLEMVTDEERDYMYLAYSADPRMRINVGIRRRLAPLMENNRRRIELLNSLLFSFPGTPIIYYGDEIGMGDNIYLGDRNGVRTPMQWSADRNAGFSRANPAKLYSPLIMDPLYGYEAINVEAQQSDSSSLLHWMRNMIALRKLFRVFGRGTLEFLQPENRKVLAYVRRYQDEQVLCVANLSRFAQPVELDVASMAGLTPVEMLGLTEFPQIAKTPYPLTLGPYGFFWFELQGSPQPLEVRPAGESMVLATARDLFSVRYRKLIETIILPAYLPKQRWFANKSRTIQQARIADWVWISEVSALVLTDVSYAEGGNDVYLVFLAVAFGPHAEALRESRPDSVISGLRMADEPGVLFDAYLDDAACLALLAAIREGAPLAGQNGRIEACALASSDTGAHEGKITRGSADQTISSVLFDGHHLLKLFRRLDYGPNPEFEVGRFLHADHRFDAVPPVEGALEYAAPGQERMTLALLQEVAPNQGDGWTGTGDELSRYYEHCATLQTQPEGADVLASLFSLSENEIPSFAREPIGLYLDSAATLGRRTAQMHAALASPSGDPAFTPEPLTRDQLHRVTAGLTEHAGSVLSSLKASLPSLPDDVVDRAALVLGQRRRILDRLRGLERIDPVVSQIRIHGDYHLAQLLRVKNDFLILGFDGESSRPLAERRSKQLALKDVAGMMRSFSYAVFASLVLFTSRRPEEYGKLEQWGAFWARWASAAFLRSYRQTADGAVFLPQRPEHFQALLDAFLLDKALHELQYELNNRPAWIRIPLYGILELNR